MAQSDIPKLIGKLGTVAVSGESMVPTYRSGDWLVVAWGARFKIGDVILVEREDRPGVFLIKRLERSEGSKYWVEGDNKLISTDSREWGFIDQNEIVGRVIFRVRKSREGRPTRKWPTGK
ncbi:MAG: S26 family signal peptidase [Actinobacteria bacterium]|nr:S26 family signal peptidase [Actinomycetota bacterium]